MLPAITASIGKARITRRRPTALATPKPRRTQPMKRDCANCGDEIDPPPDVRRCHAAVLPRCGGQATVHPEPELGEHRDRRVPRRCHPWPGTAAGAVEREEEVERLREVMRERAYARRWHRGGPSRAPEARSASADLKRLTRSRIPREQLVAIAKALAPVMAGALIHRVARRPHDRPLDARRWRR
jgi:hypothetical protein